MTKRPTLGGTDGFRGEFNNGTTPGEMNPTTVFALSQALAEITLENAQTEMIFLGADTRVCNRYLRRAAVAGVQAGGGTPVDLGTSPTPTTLKLAADSEAAGAISLTASHNPSHDGGWKGTVGSDKPYGDQVNQISNRAWEILENKTITAPEPSRMYKRSPEHVETYMQSVVTQIRQEFGQSPLAGKRVVVDAAQGAAMRVTPKIFRELGARVNEFACDGDGRINNGCGATDLSGSQAYVLNTMLHTDPDFIGIIANDGDADRVIGAYADLTNTGDARLVTIDGNRLLELMAQHEPGVVGTMYANDLSVERIRRSGTDFAFCGNGDVEVAHKLREQGWRVGSEFSGHHVDLDWLSSGDGILKGAWLAAYTASRDVTFRDIAHSMPLKPQVLYNFRLPDGTVLDRSDERLQMLNEMSQQDAENGARSIARMSGTEPLFRLCVQANTEEYVRQKLNEGREIVAAVAGTTDMHLTEQRIA